MHTGVDVGGTKVHAANSEDSEQKAQSRPKSTLSPRPRSNTSWIASTSGRHLSPSVLMPRFVGRKLAPRLIHSMQTLRQSGVIRCPAVCPMTTRLRSTPSWSSSASWLVSAPICVQCVVGQRPQ